MTCLSSGRAQHTFIKGCCNNNCVCQTVSSYYAEKVCCFNQSSELIVNGNFETGNLSPWVTSELGMGTCPQANRDWNVFMENSTGCLDVGPPINGKYAIYNMLDGTENTTYTLEQTIYIPTCFTTANISWIQSYNTSMHNQNRTISVDFYDSNLSVGNIYFFSFPLNTGGPVPWHKISKNVTSILNSQRGKSLKLRFSIFIPETWSGPAGFVMDDVSLTVF
jgi:hypothetical protein